MDLIDAPLAICSQDGAIEKATLMAQGLLGRLTSCDGIPSQIPEALWRELQLAPLGEAVQWRPSLNSKDLLGCTCYRAGPGFLLVMKEISGQQANLARKLHRQRLETTGRLAASVAHELRNAVTSIVYCADFLRVAGDRADRKEVNETTSEIIEACDSLSLTVDSLLQHARVGPSASSTLALATIIGRAERFVRAIHSDANCQLLVTVDSGAQWIRGYALSMEQIFVNLLLNAIESSKTPVTVQVHAQLSSACEVVQIHVHDDGPGISADVASSIFAPFYTTRVEGTGLGLSNAREAAEAMGGGLLLAPSPAGALFILTIPRGTP